MNASFSLVTELERLANALSADGREGTPISLQSVAERIAKSLGVKPKDRKSTRLNSSHSKQSRMPSSA